jgi:pimeloyl-ACP methyl ester carboxylesterase
VSPSGLNSQRSVNRKPGWLIRIFTGLLVIVIIFPLLGALCQTFATAIDKSRYPPPGQLVDIGGYKLHLYCTGENAGGSPTVVLETGLGGFATSPDWALVQPEIAKTTRVCAYDRAGLGWSDPSPQPRDAQHITAELHTLLVNSHTPGPYVLVGWSYGGLYARAYANQFHDEVAGLVLLDSSSPEQCSSTPAWRALCASSARNASAARILARLGLMRVIGFFQPANGLPNPQSGELLAFFSAAKDWDAQHAEFLASPVTNSQVLNSKSLGSLPLYVLTATNHGASPELEQSWQAWQSGYTTLSTKSVQRVVPGATHESFVFSPTESRISVEAILQVVAAVRSGELELGE